MQLVINEIILKRNKLIAQIATFSSLAILAIGLVFAFSKDMTKMLLSYLALVLGFILSQIGIFFTNRYARKPRYDEMFADVLQKLNNEYTFYVFQRPVPMFIVGPCNIWVPLPITSGGKVFYSKGKWRQQGGNFMMKLFAQEGIGRPEVDAIASTREISRALEAEGISKQEMPDIIVILVTLVEGVEIGDVGDAPTPIIELKKLRRYIKHYDKECKKPLAPEQLNKINESFQIRN